MKPVIEVKGLSKVYNISHEDSVDHNSLKDALVRTAKKPLELFTGHKMRQEKFWALKDINFEVGRGDVVGIIGRNGSGKSTLLKVLSQIVEPTSGEAVMRGRVASLLEVGTGFHPELTGRENVYFNGSILGMSKKEMDAKFDEIVEFSEVSQFLDTPVKFYSSGMYVRLAFAIAAHLEPDILIVDEVLAVGDASFQKKSLGKMSEVASEGRTVLFVSHSMASVKSLCNKGIYMKGGAIHDIGDIEKVAESYTNQAYDTTSHGNLESRLREKDLSLEAKFVDIKVLQSGRAPVAAIDSKLPMDIELTLNAKQELKEPVALHLLIQGSSGTALRLHTEYSKQSFKLKKGTNTVICRVDPTHLTGGSYTLDCSVLYPGREPHHIDLVPDAHLFRVKDFELEDTNIFLTQRDATYYTKQVWMKK
jgi:lipopolysaccharide transport system ATP-binding protein